MKQIFDWLREQMRLSLNEPQYFHEGEDFYNGIIHAEEIINEAEAKWEAECERADFRWRINEVLPMLEEKYLYGTASLIKAMADALGIKISEVE